MNKLLIILLASLSSIYAPIKRSRSRSPENTQITSPSRKQLRVTTEQEIGHAASYPGVLQINQNLYYGKIAERPLWYVMERVTQNNVKSWKAYAKRQNLNQRPVESIEHGLVASKAGSQYFYEVLRGSYYKFSELWVAYISNTNNIKPIPSIQSIRKDSDDSFTYNNFAQTVEMYVTIITNQDALITSHMGISRTVEGIRPNAPKNLACGLHSFAAKVMLLQNPERQYMITVPVFAMEYLLAQALPANTVFVGTKEMIAAIERKKNTTYLQFMAQIKNQLQEKLKDKAAYTARKANAFQLNDDGNLDTSKYDFDLVELNTKGQWKVAKNKIEQRLAQHFANNQNNYPLQYRKFINPVFTISIGTPINILAYNYLQKYPPRISLSSRGIITIYQKDNPDLVLLKLDSFDPTGPQQYKWMHYHHYQPIYPGHYLAVDLAALAAYGKLENLRSEHK